LGTPATPAKATTAMANKSRHGNLKDRIVVFGRAAAVAVRKADPNDPA
jgi:hypothetical protein